MNVMGQKAMESLLAKLSAVRVTLSDEEQVLLDQLILGAQDEVAAHSMVRRPEAVTRDADEVAAHNMVRGPEAAALLDAVRRLRCRGVERPRRRRLPVDDEGFVLGVVHPAAADVERARRPLEPEPPDNEAALAACELVVSQDLFLSRTARLADVVLPAASFLEKDGTFVNTERRIQLAHQAIDPPGEARDDGALLCALWRPSEE